MPVQVVGITDATAITAGYEHSCALHQDGTISCWGHNENGQLGNGTQTDSSAPVQVVGITDATAITAGYEHSCALHQDGTISCWGHNENGQLGNGTNTSSSAPVQVAGITDATAITTGDSHSCALHQTGTISCWGRNWEGQLGNGQRGYDLVSSAPVQVVVITDATEVSAGSSHSCALREGGTISCWGENKHGQLGNQRGYHFVSSAPVQVADITDATAITTGSSHSCALHQTGTISCWGRNTYGQLGNETNTESSSAPVQVLGITDATAISAGHRHSCALRQTDTISCWGNNWRGQLGNETDTEYSSAPVEVVGITDATAITAGGYSSCVVREGGTISCWGDNRSGQLGNGTDDYSLTPVQVADITDATAITTSWGHSCALREGGTISCWGNNEKGQLGNGRRGYGPVSSAPVQVAGITDATAITAGGNWWDNSHSCALHQDGTISCWGDNYYGQLGHSRWLPQFVVGFGG